MHEFSNSTIATIVTVVIAAIAGAYAVGTQVSSSHVAALQNNLARTEKELESYKISESLEFPASLGALRESAEELKLTVEERDRLKELADEVSEATRLLNEKEQTIRNLEAASAKNTESARERIQTLMNKVSLLEIELSTLTSTASEYELKEGEGVEVLPNRLTIGLESAYGTFASVNVNNDRQDLRVGNQKELRVGALLCNLSVLSVAKDSFKFRFRCEESKAGGA